MISFYKSRTTTETYTLSLHDALPILDVFVLIEDENLRLESLRIIEDLRWSGLTVDYSLTNAKSDKQFKRARSEEHTSELQSHVNLVCRLLLEKKKQKREYTKLCL